MILGGPGGPDLKRPSLAIVSTVPDHFFHFFGIDARDSGLYLWHANAWTGVASTQLQGAPTNLLTVHVIRNACGSILTLWMHISPAKLIWSEMCTAVRGTYGAHDPQPNSQADAFPKVSQLSHVIRR